MPPEIHANDFCKVSVYNIINIKENEVSHNTEDREVIEVKFPNKSQMKNQIQQMIGMRFDYNIDVGIHFVEDGFDDSVDVVLCKEDAHSINVRLRFFHITSPIDKERPFLNKILVCGQYAHFDRETYTSIGWIRVDQNTRISSLEALITNAMSFECGVALFRDHTKLDDNTTTGMIQPEHAVISVNVLQRSTLAINCTLRANPSLSHNIFLTCENTRKCEYVKELLKEQLIGLINIEDCLSLVGGENIARDEQVIGLSRAFRQKSHNISLTVYVNQKNMMHIKISFKQKNQAVIEECVIVSRDVSTKQLRRITSCIVQLPDTTIKLVLNKKKIQETNCVSKERRDFKDGAQLKVVKVEPIELRIRASSSSSDPSFTPQELCVLMYKLEDVRKLKSVILQKLNMHLMPSESVYLTRNDSELMDDNLSENRLKDRDKLMSIVYENCILVHLYYSSDARFSIVIKNPYKTTVNDLTLAFSEILNVPHTNLYIFFRHGMYAIDTQCCVASVITHDDFLVLRSRDLSNEDRHGIVTIFNCRKDGDNTDIIKTQAVFLGGRRFVEDTSETLLKESEQFQGYTFPKHHEIPVNFSNEKLKITKATIVKTLPESIIQDSVTGNNIGTTSNDIRPRRRVKTEIIHLDGSPVLSVESNTTKKRGCKESDSELSDVFNDWPIASIDEISSDTEAILPTSVTFGNKVSKLPLPGQIIKEDIKYCRKVVREGDKINCCESLMRTQISNADVDCDAYTKRCMSLSNVSPCHNHYLESKFELLKHVASNAMHTWKFLARELRIQESDIKSIEHLNHDLKECTYQMLLKWKEVFGKEATNSSLARALCTCGLKAVADEFNNMTERESC